MQKKYQITMTEAQMQALSGLIDAGVRATGLRAVNEAASLMMALERAKEFIEQEAPTDGNV